MRRSRRGKDKKTSIVILNNNLCGFNGKRASIVELLARMKPDVCTFQETNICGSNQIELKDYHMSLRNRKSTKTMGGVATAVENYLKPTTTKVAEGVNEDEYLITRLSHVQPLVNIVNLYGGQESRMSGQEILENWLRLKRDLDKIRYRQEGCLIIGDWNRAITVKYPSLAS